MGDMEEWERGYGEGDGEGERGAKRVNSKNYYLNVSFLGTQM